MMPARSRPSRSTAPTTFKHLVAPLSSSESSENEQDEGASTEGVAGPSTGAGSRKKRRKSPSPVEMDDDSSESVYDPEEEREGGKKGRASKGGSPAASAGTASDETDEGEPTTDDDEPVSEATASGSEGGPRSRSTSKKQPSTAKVATKVVGASASTSARAPGRSRKLPIFEDENNTSSQSPRASAPPRPTKTAVYFPFRPLYEPDGRTETEMLQWIIGEKGMDARLYRCLAQGGRWDAAWCPPLVPGGDIRPGEFTEIAVNERPAYFPSRRSKKSGVYPLLQVEANATERAGGDGSTTVLLGPLSTAKGKGKAEDDTMDVDTEEQILSQKEVQIAHWGSERLEQHGFPGKPTVILNASGPVSSISWAPACSCSDGMQFLALTTNPEGGRSFSVPPSRGAGMIQIWAVTPSSTRADEPGEAKLVMALCVDEIEGQEGGLAGVQWAPVPRSREEEKGAEEKSTARRLAALVGGKVVVWDLDLSILAGKEPAKFVRAAPRLVLGLPHTPFTSFDWASGSLLAAGALNGHVAIYSLALAFATPPGRIIRPTHYFPVHQTAIRTLAWVRSPPLSTARDGTLDPAAQPMVLGSTSVDGAVRLIDLMDWESTHEIHYERGVNLAGCYSPYAGSIAFSCADGSVRVFPLSPGAARTKTTRLETMQGAVLDLKASDWHPFLAVASAAGECVVVNAVRGGMKKLSAYYSLALYMVDFNRQTGSTRMVDNLAPRVRVPVAKASEPEMPWPIARPPEAAVKAVAWCPQREYCHWLASGTELGLVRIDCMPVE